MSPTRKLLIVVNDAGFFLSHRLAIAQAAQENGYDVHVATAAGPAVKDILALGFVHHAVSLTRSGTNLFVEFGTVLSLYRLFCRVSPDLVHLVTIKPILFGGIAARMARVPAVVVAVSGLGFAFMATGLKAAVLRFLIVKLYRAILAKRNLRVICQNPDDRTTLERMAKVPSGKISLIPGSGVDLSKYVASGLSEGSPVVVVMAARLLGDKGVYEFISAARILKHRGTIVLFRLAGEPDSGNPATVTRQELLSWEEEGCVDLVGYCDNIADLFALADMVVLPSYYGEGLPKVLIEAAACGRAVVTTNHPGCRDAIIPGETGLLVPPKDTAALADAIQYLIDHPQTCAEMGRAGRRLAESRFAIESVVDAHLKIYRELEAAI